MRPAVTMAAAPPFWSTLPRPWTKPSRIFPENGSSLQFSRLPWSTVSMWASMASRRLPLPTRPWTLPRPSRRTLSKRASSICRLSSAAIASSLAEVDLILTRRDRFSAV